MSDQELLIYSLSKKKEGKALLAWMEEECCRRFTNDDVKNVHQQGKYNLYLDLLDMVERGDTAANKGKGE